MRSPAPWTLVAVFAAVLGACSQEPAPTPSPDDPVAIVRAFLVAVRAEDCERAWAFLSQATRSRAGALAAERRQSDLPGRAPVDAESLYCVPSSLHRFHQHEVNSAELLSRTATQAVVEVVRREGRDYRLPGFWPARWEFFPEQIELTREAGSWRLVIP